MVLRNVNAVVTITTNAVKAIDDGKKLKEVYAAINQQLNQMRGEGKVDTTEFKEMQELAKDVQEKLRTLVTGMKLIRGVADNLANKTGKDINRALRETAKEFGKTANDTDRHKQKLEQLRQSVEKFKREVSDRRGLTMSFQDAQKQLNNLNKTSLDNLNKGLAAIKEKLAQPLSNKWRQQLEEMQSRYQAAITVRQTPVTQRPVASMNTAQLKAEQTAITSALAATSGTKGFERQAALYGQRLKEINGQLSVLAEKERVAATGAKQLAATQQAAKTVQAVYRGQAVSLEQLNTAYKTLEARANRFEGVKPAKAKAARQQMEMLGQTVKKLKGELLSEAEIQERVNNKGKYSVKQLQQAYDQLAARLKTLNTGQKKDIEETRRQMASLKKTIDSTTGSVSKHGGIWQTAVRNITAYVGVFGAFNTIKGWLTDIIKLNAKLSDQMADIRKVSGLSMESIRELTTNLSKIDTRTTLEELNRIAYAGAKLGFGNYGIEGLEQFTKAANQVNVALKEDLGDEALTALSKITENMGLIKKMGVEDAMLATGSAMFKLASSSTAAAGPIVEITKRLVPVAKASGLATSEILALSSAADSLQLMPEVVGTALSKFIMALQTNHNLIENFFHIEPGTIANLFQTGKAMDALLLVFDKMKGKNVTELSDVWKLLGSNGQRLMTVLLSMANATDRVREHLQISNQAFKEGIAVTEEYNIQQDTAQALYERAQNMWRNAFVNPEASESIKEIAKAWYDFTREITSGGAALWSLKQAVDLFIVSLKILIYLLPGLAIGGIVRGLGSLVIALGGAKVATDGLTLSWKKMTAATKANWIGLLATAIAQVVYWVSAWADANEEAEEKQRRLNYALAEADEKAEKEITNLTILKKQLEDTNITTEERQRILTKINGDYDIYLDYLGIEINTVQDLTGHYQELTRVMRQHQAYLTREDYKKEVMEGEGGLRMKRREAGRELTKKARNYGIDVDLDLIKNQPSGRINYVLNQLFPGFPALQAEFKPEVAAYMKARGNEREKEFEIDEEFAQDVGGFNPDKMNRPRIRGEFQPARDKAAGRGQAKAARAAAQARAKSERERRKQLQQELKEAEQESQAIIDKIEEWYRLQETDVENLVADGKKTRAEADAYLKDLKKSKNKTLANARLSISGKMKKKDWDKYIAAELPKMMADQGEWSSELAQDIINTNLQYIHNRLARFDGSAKVLGVKSTASFDKIEKNAAGNLREIARDDAKIKEEVEKILLEYKYVEQAERSFHDNLVGLGIMAETYEQYTKRMKEEAEANKNKTADSNGSPDGMDGGSLENVVVTAKRPQSPEEKLLKQFLANGAKPYGVNIENDRELFVWLKNLMSNYDYDEEDNIMFHEEDWVKGFPQLKQWVEDIDKYRPDIQKFYLSLINWEESYYDAKRKAYEHDKKQQEMRFKVSGEQDAYDNQQQSLEFQSKFQQASGAGLNFGQQYGLADAIANDPEVQRIQLRMEWRQKELEDAQAHGAAQELINERQTELLEEFSNLATKVSAEVAARVQKIQGLSEPLYSWGEEVGQMLGEQWQGISQEGKLTFAQMTRNMAIEYAKQTLKMASENLTKKLQQGLFYKQMEMQEMQHQVQLYNIQQAGAAARATGQLTAGATLQSIKATQDASEIGAEGGKATVMTMFGVSEGAAKTIAKLGWWGIPLIGVITSILMGLLNSAKATANQNSSSSTSNTPKLKLASGMLTYDQGNADTAVKSSPSGDRRGAYVGTDGHIYRAAPQSALPDGVQLIRRPIATTVNGQPSLVAERGPEIIIGRRATRHIQMNEPGLLHHLAAINGRYRTYDEGTIPAGLAGMAQLPAPQGMGSGGEADTRIADALDQNTQMMAAFVQMMNTIQQRGISAHIQKYGSGGLIDEVKSGLKFDQRYNR